MFLKILAYFYVQKPFLSSPLFVNVVYYAVEFVFLQRFLTQLRIAY